MSATVACGKTDRGVGFLDGDGGGIGNCPSPIQD